MKTVRIILLVVNFSLVAVLGYLTYFLFIGGDFFEEKVVSLLEPRDYLSAEPIRIRRPWALIDSLVSPLAEPAQPKEEAEPEPEVATIKPITDNVKVWGVIYDEEEKGATGIVADVKGIPRYISIGDVVLEEPLITLGSITEVEKGKKYLLKFFDKNDKELPVAFTLE